MSADRPRHQGSVEPLRGDGRPHLTHEAVRGAIMADLAPVRPLRPPMRRALALVPMGAALLAIQPLYWGLRADADVLGWLAVWGFSATQSLLGVALVAAALREAVPGRRLPRAAMLLAAGVAASIAITFVTWQRSATLVPPGHEWSFWTICFSRSALIGAPVLAIALALAWRAYPLRAALVGALAGLGVGLMTDAGWRTFCHVSDPVHVLGAHLASILALTVTGAATALVLARLRE